ncbi:Hpt domain-containing protein [Butyrivibrio sp. VCD2006]|uniref:Hpt domain-containing protein n=1 Tax=Butyrivibrio sp. VCD2006 TaxID=1280664 RepID=UPI0003FEDBB5|nr:Hpt domain-containing protein [Butyrivibrio sp. VCD2006]
MNAQMKQELIDWGVNWSDVQERFMGNEDLVEKFMLKFLNDSSFNALTEGLAAKNAEEAFKGCHTLKGVTGNLALDGMRPDVLELTEILRAGSLDGSEELYQKIKKSYDALIGILKKYA